MNVSLWDARYTDGVHLDIGVVADRPIAPGYYLEIWQYNSDGTFTLVGGPSNGAFDVVLTRPAAQRYVGFLIGPGQSDGYPPDSLIRATSGWHYL